MASYNKVILIGNLTRDPELRYTPKGTAIARIALAVNRNWRTDSGEMRDEVTFIDIDAFGKQAEVIGEYLAKEAQLWLKDVFVWIPGMTAPQDKSAPRC
jgi:single-strand DNA-binding protein